MQTIRHRSWFGAQIIWNFSKVTHLLPSDTTRDQQCFWWFTCIFLLLNVPLHLRCKISFINVQLLLNAEASLSCSSLVISNIYVRLRNTVVEQETNVSQWPMVHTKLKKSRKWQSLLVWWQLRLRTTPSPPKIWTAIYLHSALSPQDLLKLLPAKKLTKHYFSAAECRTNVRAYKSWVVSSFRNYKNSYWQKSSISLQRFGYRYSA